MWCRCLSELDVQLEARTGAGLAYLPHVQMVGPLRFANRPLLANES
jgi:hypothetical protein